MKSFKKKKEISTIQSMINEPHLCYDIMYVLHNASIRCNATLQTCSRDFPSQVNSILVCPFPYQPVTPEEALGSPGEMNLLELVCHQTDMP